MSSSPTAAAAAAAAAAPAQEDAEEYAAAADYYCGKTWQDASTTCQTPCPSGEDWECGNAADAGSGEITCHGYTGCSSSSSSTSSSTTAASPNQPRPPKQQQQQHLANNGGKLSAHDVYSSEDGAVTQLSYGIIFDIQTSVTSLVPMPIQIVALDIYTPIQNEIIYYELYYTKRDLLLDDGGGAIAAIGGTTEDDDDGGIVVGLPQLDTFTLVMNGTIQSSSWIPPPPLSSSSNSSSNNVANNNVGELTRISINNNNNNSNNNTAPLLLLEGGGSRYSIYFTLNSRNLLYAREHSSTSLQYSWDDEEKEEEKNGYNATIRPSHWDMLQRVM